MFRKTWKQIRILILLIITIGFFPRSILPRHTSYPDKNEFESYSKLNESEQRLLEFKDNPEALRLKLIQLDVINRSRMKNNAPPVKLDILGCRVANKMCREAAKNDFSGHWNLAGEKPYHRYAFAGGYDHVSENAFASWSSDNFNTSYSNISLMMKSGHDSFMAERAPNDGHKRTIIDKSHNFVGIGFFIEGNQFRYYEEFIDRYFEFECIPDELKVGEEGNITVKTDGKQFIYFLMIYREDYPTVLTPAQIKRKGSYQDYTNEVYLTMTAWDLARYRKGYTYKIPLRFSKEGLYYIQIYYDKKEIVKPSSLNTKGKTPASGIVIKVTK
jgi:hypothetical protein